MQHKYRTIIFLCSCLALNPLSRLEAAQAIDSPSGTPPTTAQALEVAGEVHANTYASFRVTPRIAAQVIKRQARLGDMVRVGAPLVTLSSVELAQAQGEMVLAEREWKRVQELGQDVVSGRRYVEASVARELARAKVEAYGMSAPQIDALLRDKDPTAADGTFVLTSPGSGRVVADDFVEGEIVQPGRALFEITDETLVWVDAHVAPEQSTTLRVGMPVRVRAGKTTLSGRIMQTLHRLDEQTRTYLVRCEVQNRGDALHPGQFVYVALPIAATQDTGATP